MMSGLAAAIVNLSTSTSNSEYEGITMNLLGITMQLLKKRSSINNALALCIISLLAFTTELMASSYENPTWHKHADGVYTFETSWLNSIVVEGDKGMLVMDTYNQPHSQALKLAINNKFNKPVTHVVYSHAHADHTRGSTLYFDQEYRFDFGGRKIHLKDYGENHATGVTVFFKAVVA